MKAVCWEGKHSVKVENVPDPRIEKPRDAIIKVALSAICGSDIHLYNGMIPTMEKGDILGHEFAGEIVALGTEVKNLKIGDRVVVPFPIACGKCFFCQEGLWSLCDVSNPNAEMAEKVYGHPTAGIFGYSHLTGGYPGGQAEFVRVPFADVGPLIIPENVTYEEALFLGDILPTGYMAAENCRIKPGHTVAVWGCGPVGLFAIRSAYLLGAERVVAIDRFPERLALAKKWGADVIDYSHDKDVSELLNEKTRGRGPDSCIDAVGLEAHGHTPGALYDSVKQTLKLETDRPYVLREAILACRKGGVVSIPGVYGGIVDKIPFGAAFQKGLHLEMGQTHVHKYMRPLLAMVEEGKFRPTDIISHRLTLDEAPMGYEKFVKKEDNCTKVVLAA